MPELRQVTGLKQSDFERHAVWVGVHRTDYEMPWYEECDEATYRPWDGPLPVAAKDYILLVAATFELRDGTRYPGYFSPLGENWDEPPEPSTRRMTSLFGESSVAILGQQLPHIFAGGRQIRFWGGRHGVPADVRQFFYSAVGDRPENIFPIQFSADPGLATGIVTGRVDGFYRAPYKQMPVVEL